MGMELATFGMGCFWGSQKIFDKGFGALGIKTQVGYAGGKTANPTYRQVCSGDTGHAEVVQIEYDPAKVEYATLVDFFYRTHDPTTLNRQGNDRGTQYRSTIFYHNDSQKKIAEQVTEKVKPHYGRHGIATTIEPIGSYFSAEDYHQDYLVKEPHGYECPTHFIRSWEKIDQMYGGGPQTSL
ncbi:hypothetical protein SmJEL517_g03190 [Synchytrium microbalum]|uniref:peptide-methionine (S)-S-oxide reductase n=1 Tax=Synchytrium microbalum TaxID=1806994 RepID=A0A507BYT7_9FUNG|nr:uncharacterized protein SmJEL517_g03190 [Synchytrium microbalum]TPX33977.1 hypothetical protein SmJEL517_g03190 [Synchytrium microbalum]